MKQEVVRIFDDLEALHNFCRIELKPFSPTDLYNKESQIWRNNKLATSYDRGTSIHIKKSATNLTITETST